MLLQNLFPYLPVTITETLVYVVAFLGAVLITYAVFLEQERRQDLVMIVGAFGLLVYAIFIHNRIFIVAMGGLALASAVEFTEILVGLHKHSPEDLKKYKRLK